MSLTVTWLLLVVTTVFQSGESASESAGDPSVTNVPALTVHSSRLCEKSVERALIPSGDITTHKQGLDAPEHVSAAPVCTVERHGDGSTLLQDSIFLPSGDQARRKSNNKQQQATSTSPHRFGHCSASSLRALLYSSHLGAQVVALPNPSFEPKTHRWRPGAGAPSREVPSQICAVLGEKQPFFAQNSPKTRAKRPNEGIR